MGEIPKKPEESESTKSIDKPEIHKNITEARKSIEAIALKEFEQSKFGKEIIERFALGSIGEIFADETTFKSILPDLISYQKEIDSVHFRALMITVSMSFPDIIEKLLIYDPGFQIDDPEILQIIISVLGKKGYKLEDYVSGSPRKLPEGEDDSFMLTLPPSRKYFDLPEYVSTPTRDLLFTILTKEERDKLHPIVQDIIGDHLTFFDAMNNGNDSKPFNKFKKQIRKLKKELDPELYSEILIVVAETSGEMEIIFSEFKDKERNPVKSWHQMVASPELFKSLMTEGSGFNRIGKGLRPVVLVYELLLVAAKSSKENAQWILDKIERDEKGYTEEGKLEDNYYILRDFIKNKKAFEEIIATAQETMEG